MCHKMNRINVLLFTISLILTLSISIPVLANPEEAIVCLDETGKTVISEAAENLFAVLSDIQPGDNISITCKFQNDYISENSDYAGFYLKAFTETFDPEMTEYSYDYWEKESGKALNEYVSRDEGDEEKEEWFSIMNDYADKLHKDTFGREDLTDDEQMFYDVLHRIEIVIDPLSPYTYLENPVMIGMNGLIPLAGLNPGEEVTCSLTMSIPEDLSEEEVEMLRSIRWELSVKKLGSHPCVEIMIEYTNKPKNGLFFTATPPLQNYQTEEDWEREDCAVMTHIVITNTGNIPIKYYQLIEGETGYRHGSSFTGIKESGGAYYISQEDAESGGKELTARFEGVLDNPDFPEHMIATDSVWIPAGIEERESEAEESTLPKVTEPVPSVSEDSLRESRIIESLSTEISVEEVIVTEPQKKQLVPICIAVIVILLGAGVLIYIRRRS